MKSNEATVLKVSRRHASVYLNNQTHNIIIERKHSNILPGDIVELDETQQQILTVKDRYNLISRSYQNKTKEIVANIDHLLLITAPPPLFNLNVIDRILALSATEKIATTIVLNKKDLDFTEINPTLDYYKKIGINVIFSQANQTSGLEQVKQFLNSSQDRAIALSGISGVGKSTIISGIIDEIDLKTAKVSSKTGQGKQTTSQVEAYPYQNSKFLFDVPGIQNFGLSHLDHYQLKNVYPEFLDFSPDCEYKDCLHLEEPNCGIKNAIFDGNILESRYNSYTHIIEEIKSSKPY